MRAIVAIGIGVVLACGIGLAAAQQSASDGLRNAIEASLQAREILFPITAEQLETAEARAFIEDAIDAAIRNAAPGKLQVTVTAEAVLLKVVEQSFAVWKVTPETLAEQDRRAREFPDDVMRFRDDVRAALRGTFSNPVVVTARAERAEPKFNPLQSLGGGESRDLFAGSLDYRTVWARMLETVRAYPLIVDREFPAVKDGKRTLRTAPAGSKDDSWLYQSYYEVMLFDPGAQDPKARGQEFRIGVEYVVGRRKQAGGFTYIHRSNAVTERLLQALLDAVRR